MAAKETKEIKITVVSSQRGGGGGSASGGGSGVPGDASSPPRPPRKPRGGGTGGGGGEGEEPEFTPQELNEMKRAYRSRLDEAREELKEAKKREANRLKRLTDEERSAEIDKKAPSAQQLTEKEQAHRAARRNQRRHRRRQQSVAKTNRDTKVQAATTQAKDQDRQHSRHRSRQLSIAKQNRAKKQDAAKKAEQAKVADDKEQQRQHDRHRSRQHSIAKKNRWMMQKMADGVREESNRQHSRHRSRQLNIAKRNRANKVNAAQKATGNQARAAVAGRRAGLRSAADMRSMLAGKGLGSGAGLSALLGPLGIAATAASVAITGLAVASSLAMEAVKAVDETMKALVRSAAQFNGPLAATVATVDVQRLQKEMERSQRLGPELTQFARSRGDLDLALDEIITTFLKPMIPVVNDIAKDTAEIALGFSEFLKTPVGQGILDGMSKGFDGTISSLSSILGIGGYLEPILNELRRLARAAEKADANIFRDQEDLLAGRIGPGVTIPSVVRRGRGMYGVLPPTP